MTHYYGIELIEGVLRLCNLYEMNDYVTPDSIARCETSKIKGGYCVYIYIKGIESPQFCFPNLGDDENGKTFAKNITEIIFYSLKKTTPKANNPVIN